MVEIASGLARFSNIRILDLTDNRIDLNNGCNELKKFLGGTKSLEKLILRGNKIKELGVKDIAEGLSNNSSLIFLDLYDSDFGSNGASLLAGALKINQSLTGLNLEKTLIHISGVWAIYMTLRYKKGFQFEFDDHFASVFPHSSEFADLDFASILDVDVSFKLSNDQEDIQLFMKLLESFEFVETLNLRENVFNSYENSDTIEFLGKLLAESKSVRIVDIAKCNIEAAVLQNLIPHLSKAASLEELCLNNNSFGDLGAEFLIELSKSAPIKLNRIDILGTDISESCLDRLVKAWSNKATINYQENENYSPIWKNIASRASRKMEKLAYSLTKPNDEKPDDLGRAETLQEIDEYQVSETSENFEDFGAFESLI
ncbi:NACHT, LRR and PYD domains-containing protein 3 [Physocladia obscura]|uniref:NACHT, LRR and PYD domains-containing protein 3 n=1 Tax=Physocladia obscura TaxID=109957 RepID=A0AAD5SV57_9FUNG|nr:NACHT, LRR and PYD domains-containing protein 3 [Physocladia obscura]